MSLCTECERGGGETATQPNSPTSQNVDAANEIKDVFWRAAPGPL